jgi:hypothetical protein
MALIVVLVRTYCFSQTCRSGARLPTSAVHLVLISLAIMYSCNSDRRESRSSSLFSISYFASRVWPTILPSSPGHPWQGEASHLIVATSQQGGRLEHERLPTFHTG